MKPKTNFFALFLIITSCILASCGLGKKAQLSNVNASKQTTVKAVPESNSNASLKVYAAVPAKKESTASPTNTPVSPPITLKAIDMKANTNNIEVYEALPPLSIEKAFKSDYPSAKNVVWTIEKPTLTLEHTRTYKANFAMAETKIWAIYGRNGVVIETEEQILPEQLPAVIYDAIKSKYPEVYIVSASLIKSHKVKGSYAAVIRPYVMADRTEIILSENGTFVR
jgi:hypothetical protein